MAENIEPTTQQKYDYMIALQGLLNSNIDPNSNEFKVMLAELAETYLVDHE
jgi:hypothetical protein